MEDVKSLVSRSQAGDLEAYGRLVQNFQDMAFGYSYSLLGDFHLAEDAAQEAFLEAYQNLWQLRDPMAFPGWFKRVIFSRCQRILRRKQPSTMSLDEMLPAQGKEPSEMMAQAELRDSISAAIRSLPQEERTATTLFYINGYSQADIAGFLEVPVTTVKSRLHASRKRLNERMIDMMADEINSHKPGAEQRRAIMDELEARQRRFDQSLGEWTAEMVTEWANSYHQRRLENVRANAAQYGVSPDVGSPRMLPKHLAQETFRDDFKDMPKRWGFPDGLQTIFLRELCREVLVTPLALHRWIAEGLPVLRYEPWYAFDRARALDWIGKRGIKADERMTDEEAREPLLVTIRVLAQGKASVAEAVQVYLGLKTSVVRSFTCREKSFDPVWDAAWKAQHENERRANARLYGLSEPTMDQFGVPWETCRAFEIRDLTRRLGISPVDIIRWTRDGMPCLRESPLVRWDIRHVTAWVAEHEELSGRAYTPKELDLTWDFVLQRVADGNVSAETAREIFAGWVALM